jgi:hypothetical protein
MQANQATEIKPEFVRYKRNVNILLTKFVTET